MNEPIPLSVPTLPLYKHHRNITSMATRELEDKLTVKVQLPTKPFTSLEEWEHCYWTVFVPEEDPHCMEIPYDLYAGPAIQAFANDFNSSRNRIRFTDFPDDMKDDTTVVANVMRYRGVILRYSMSHYLSKRWSTCPRHGDGKDTYKPSDCKHLFCGFKSIRDGFSGGYQHIIDALVEKPTAFPMLRSLFRGND